MASYFVYVRTGFPAEDRDAEDEEAEGREAKGEKGAEGEEAEKPEGAGDAPPAMGMLGEEDRREFWRFLKSASFSGMVSSLASRTVASWKGGEGGNKNGKVQEAG